MTNFGGQISALKFGVKCLDNLADVIVAGSVPLLPRTVPFPLRLVDRADKVESDSFRFVRVVVEVADDVCYVAGESPFSTLAKVSCPDFRITVRVTVFRQKSRRAVDESEKVRDRHHDFSPPSETNAVPHTCSSRKHLPQLQRIQRFGREQA